MTKQTALDWYWDKIKSHFEHDGDLLETATFTLAIAKQKEREQIISAFDDGQESEYQYQVNSEKRLDADKYFSETYQSKQK